MLPGSPCLLPGRPVAPRRGAASTARRDPQITHATFGFPLRGRRVRSPGRLRNRPWRTSRRRSLLVPDVIIGLHSVETAGSPAAAAESGGPSRTGTSRSAELFDEFGVDADDPVAALDAGLARGNPRRRLPDGSKGCLGVMVAVHDRPPRHTEQEDRSLRSAGAASRFPPERTPRSRSRSQKRMLRIDHTSADNHSA